MADFSRIKLNQVADSSNQLETAALVKLAEVELATKRLNVQRKITNAMLAVTCLFACFTIAIVVVLGVSLQQMRSALDTIASSVGPNAVQQAVESVQLSLNNTVGATGNMRILSSDIREVGFRMVEAANASVALLASSNALMSEMASHPQFTLALGAARS